MKKFLCLLLIPFGVAVTAFADETVATTPSSASVQTEDAYYRACRTRCYRSWNPYTHRYVRACRRGCMRGGMWRPYSPPVMDSQWMSAPVDIEER